MLAVVRKTHKLPPDHTVTIGGGPVSAVSAVGRTGRGRTGVVWVGVLAGAGAAAD